MTKAIDRGVRDGLILGMNFVVTEAKGLAPVRTGALANSIVAMRVTGNFSDGEASAGVKATAAYAHFVEFGTGIHGPKGEPFWVEPQEKQALRFEGPGGGVFFSKGHFISGMKPQPFLNPALEDNTDLVLDIVSDAIELAMLEEDEE
jgi:HK97 gp10 family phage protein